MSAIDVMPPPPSRQVTDPKAWSGEMHAFLSRFGPFSEQMNAVAAEFMMRLVQAFSGATTDEMPIEEGTKVISASQGMALVAGHSVIIAARIDPDSQMQGLVTDYDPQTGELTVDVTLTQGSGTFDDWTIGITFLANEDEIDLSVYLTKADNLASLDDASTARSNLGLGSIATLAAPSGSVVGTSGAQTLTNKTLTSPVLTGTPTTDEFTISDGASVTIDPADGEVQFWTLGANRTPTLTSISAGKGVLLMIDDGSAYTLTLSGGTWLNNGGSAPTLKTSGWTPILIFKLGGNLYFWLCGDGG
jgi:hypothetical protein